MRTKNLADSLKAIDPTEFLGQFGQFCQTLQARGNRPLPKVRDYVVLEVPYLFRGRILAWGNSRASLVPTADGIVATVQAVINIAERAPYHEFCDQLRAITLEQLFDPANIQDMIDPTLHQTNPFNSKRARDLRAHFPIIQALTDTQKHLELPAFNTITKQMKGSFFILDRILLIKEYPHGFSNSLPAT